MRKLTLFIALFFHLLSGALFAVAAYATPAKLTVTLTGCGARMGRVAFYRADGFTDPMDQKAGCEFRQGLHYNPLSADRLTCVFTAEAGAKINLRTSHYSYQASDRFWGVHFNGFAGQCAGQGNYLFNQGLHECEFTMPAKGTYVNVQFETSFGDPGDLPGALCNTGPTSNPGNGKSSSALDGSALLGAVNSAVASTFGAFGLTPLLQSAALSVNLPGAKNTGQFTVTLTTAVNARLSSSRSTKLVTVASGRVSVAARSGSLIKLKLSKSGSALLKAKKSIRLTINTTFDPTKKGLKTISKSKTFTLR